MSENKSWLSGLVGIALVGAALTLGGCNKKESTIAGALVGAGAGAGIGFAAGGGTGAAIGAGAGAVVGGTTGYLVGSDKEEGNHEEGYR